jgi:D-alanyl-D-alanine carboxypeptidase (penicillin-binding protein 5/6)
MIVKVGAFCLLLILLLYIFWSIFRPFNSVEPTITFQASNRQTTNSNNSIQWAPVGEQALSVAGYNLVATHGEQKQVPIASIAKVMVALAVLDKMPLQLNQQGPEIEITDNDVEIYKNALLQNHSNIPVISGEKISEYQALQALLLPSANNIAVTLTNWAFGSQEEYIKFANQYSKKLGMSNTNFSDASGFDPKTVSTPADLLLLGEQALKNPVIAQIVNQKSADIPVAGTITNTNKDLGLTGINGIKTGTTLQAGGCLLFSASNGNNNIIGVILGDTDSGSVLLDAQKLSQSAIDNVTVTTVIKVNQKVGEYKLPWGQTINAIAVNDISIANLKSDSLNSNINLEKISPQLYNKDNVGNVNAKYNNKNYTTNIKLQESISKPSIWWRIWHPLS